MILLVLNYSSPEIGHNINRFLAHQPDLPHFSLSLSHLARKEIVYSRRRLCWNTRSSDASSRIGGGAWARAPRHAHQHEQSRQLRRGRADPWKSHGFKDNNARKRTPRHLDEYKQSRRSLEQPKWIWEGWDKTTPSAVRQEESPRGRSSRRISKSISSGIRYRTKLSRSEHEWVCDLATLPCRAGDASELWPSGINKTALK